MIESEKPDIPQEVNVLQGGIIPAEHPEVAETLSQNYPTEVLRNALEYSELLDKGME